MKINTGKSLTLTQDGLNKVLWMLIKSKGGRLVIREKDLIDVPNGSALRVDHFSDTNEFVLSLTKVNTSPIIIPN